VDVSDIGAVRASASFLRSARAASGATTATLFISSSGVTTVSMATGDSAGDVVSLGGVTGSSFGVSGRENTIVVFLLDARGGVSPAMLVTFLRTTS
jgi:hypothetical protein